MLGPDRILALDIGASTVKVAEFQTSKTHGLRLTNFNHADLGIDPEHEENRKALIVSTIRNILREKNIHTTKVIFSVSGQSVFTRFVKLPPVDQSKVEQIIKYEAQQNVPFPIDEVIWDYQLLGATEQGELEVILLAIKSDIIEELTEGIESAGLRAETVDVAPMALYNSVRYNCGDLEGCTIVVDIGARTTNLLFIEQNRVFSRSIPIAGNAITQSIAAEFNVPFLEAEQMKKSQGFVALGGAYEEPENEAQSRISKIIRNVMTRLHAEVARSINFYRSQQGGSAPVRLLLSGGSSIIPYTDRFFKEKVQISIEYFNPFRNVEIDARVAKEDLSRCAHFYGEVVGLGLRKHTECPIEVNLTPKTVSARKQFEQKRPYFLGAAICLLLIPLCWLGYTKKITTLKQRQLEAVTTQLNGLRDFSQKVAREQGLLTELQKKADQITGLVQQRSLWPEILQDVNVRLVPDLWIVSLTPQLAATATSDGGGRAPAQPARGRGRVVTRDDESGGEEEPAYIPSGGGAPAGPRMITDLRIEGAGNHSEDNPEHDLQLVDNFARNLRESSYFETNGVDIVELPNAMVKDPTFKFTLRAKLSKPIPM